MAVDWATWQPTDTAVLTFIRSEGRLLLILKKRGLGCGFGIGMRGRRAILPNQTDTGILLNEVLELRIERAAGLALHVAEFNDRFGRITVAADRIGRQDAHDGELVGRDGERRVR